MFGLRNIRNSCWVNGALQMFFACPVVRKRYSEPLPEDAIDIDKALYKVYTTKGEEGLPEVFAAIQSKYMPAGKSEGDSHELLVFLCDVLPWMDKEVRFKIADAITCISCNKTVAKEDTVVEVDLHPTRANEPLLDVITHAFRPETIPDWKCEACHANGCTKQRMFGSFPRTLMLHTLGGAIDYSSVLIMNGRKYVLGGILCYNGSHWWTYARSGMGYPWYRLDDSRVDELTARQFPVTNAMRALLYFLLEN